MNPLRAWMKERGLTQQQMAAQIGVHQTTLARLMSGSRAPSKEMARAIEAATGVRFVQMWERGEERWRIGG